MKNVNILKVLEYTNLLVCTRRKKTMKNRLFALKIFDINKHFQAHFKTKKINEQ